MPDFAVTFVTNRARDALGFGPLADARLRAGTVKLRRPSDPELTEDIGKLRDGIRWEEDDFATPTGPCAKVLDAWLDGAAAAGAVPLLLIPGFANSFESAVGRAAQLMQWFEAGGLKLAPLVFSWPSDGKVISSISDLTAAYRQDVTDAAASGPALARVLLLLAEAKARATKRGTDVSALSLLAHSMGNRALRAGLEALRSRGGLTPALNGLFRQSVLAAADDNDTELEPEGGLRPIADLSGTVTVLTSFDTVLTLLSEKIAGNARRLGAAGPRDVTNLPANVAVVNCGFAVDRKEAVLKQGVTEWDAIGHQYYRNDPFVRRDMIAILQGTAPEKIEKREKVSPTMAKGNAALAAGTWRLLT